MKLILFLLLLGNLNLEVMAVEQKDYEKEIEKDVEYSKKGAPHNFGVVVFNDQYKIYRSSKLGSKGLKNLSTYLKRKDLPFPKTIIYMNKEGYKKKIPSFTYFAIQEHQEQEKYGYDFFHSFDYEYRTYIEGKNPYFPTEDIDKTNNLSAKAKKIFGKLNDGKKDGGLDAFIRVLKLVLDPQRQPVLFHCFGGRHRTGMIAMAIRYLQGGEWIEGKKRPIFILPHFRKVYLNPAQYEYALHNRELFRFENIQFIEKFVEDERFLSLREEFREELNKISEEAIKRMLLEDDVKSLGEDYDDQKNILRVNQDK